jgi:uncharacterized protein
LFKRAAKILQLIIKYIPLTTLLILHLKKITALNMKGFIKFLLRTLVVLFILLNVTVAFHAYKFTHFYNHGDIVVKKQSDKTGWDITKEIMFGINAQKQLNSNTSDSALQSIILTTHDSLKLEGWYIPAPNAKGTVCLFHGHGSKKSGTNDEAREFRKMGYNTFQLDFRAHGNSQGNTCTIGYDESEDVKLAYDYIANKGEKNIVLWGISMGAAAVSKSLDDYPLRPSKVILEMPFGTIEDAVKGRIKMMGLPPEPFTTLITFWGGVEHGFWAYSMKPTQYVKNINCPVLVQWGAQDHRVTRKETETIYTNIPGTKKLVVYENSGHESLCIKENDKWTGQVTAFLQQ